MNEHKNIITIEDEIKEFSDKPVKSSALFNALKERGVPDSSEASVGDVLTKGEDGIGWETPSGGGGAVTILSTDSIMIDGHEYTPGVDAVYTQGDLFDVYPFIVSNTDEIQLYWIPHEGGYYLSNQWVVSKAPSPTARASIQGEGFYFKPNANMVDIASGTIVVTSNDLAYGDLYLNSED